MPKQIKLINRNMYALVDDKNYDMLNSLRWYRVKTPYTNYAYTKINGQTVYMHQLVMPSDDLELTPDHINHNGLDNQESNLRLATGSQQTAHRKRQSNGLSSKYRGVRFSKGKWEANIRSNSNQKYLGRFRSEVAAAKAYNHAATLAFGEFAELNTFEGSN